MCDKVKELTNEQKDTINHLLTDPRLRNATIGGELTPSVAQIEQPVAPDGINPNPFINVYDEKSI